MTPRDFALLAQEAYSAKPDIGKADSASRAIVRQTAGGLVGQVHHGFWKAWGAIASM